MATPPYEIKTHNGASSKVAHVSNHSPFAPEADQVPQKSFQKKNKKTIIFASLGVILVLLVIGFLVKNESDGPSGGALDEVSDGPSVGALDEVDVNGLTVSEACEKVRAAGWKVEEVAGTGDYTEKSDCSDNERRVARTYYHDDDGTVGIRFANESKSEDAETTEETPTEAVEETPGEAPVEEASTGEAASGYQAIYDEYSARLENECPNLSTEECAEISNEGVGKMADYMYGASGTDGQYETYDSWARKLMGVYISSAR